MSAIVLLAFFLRVVYLDQKSLWWDESTTLNHIRHGFAFIFTNQMKWGDNIWLDNHLPLYFLFMFFFARFGGTSDFAIRFPSAAWGVLLCVLLYTAGRKLIDRRVGFLAAVIGALSPFYIWFSQSARMHILVPLLGLLAVYLLWMLMEGRSWPWHVAFVLVNAALLYTNILSLSVILFEGLVVAIRWLRRRDWRLVATFAVVSASATPVVWFGLSRSGRRIREEMLPFSLIFKDVLHSYNAGLSLDTINLQWWDWAFLAVFALGALMLIERHRSMRARKALFLAGYALVTFLVLYLVPPINLHYMGARYAVIGSPAFYLLLATGLETLRAKVKWASVPAFALVGAIFGISTFRYFFVPPYTLHRGHDYRSAAEFVNARAYAGDAIVGSPFSYDAFYRYMDPQLPWYGLPRVTYRDEATFYRDTVPELEALKAKYDRVWFIDADYLYVEQNRGITKRWLDQNCVQFTTQSFAYVTTRGYLTRSPLLDDRSEAGTSLDVTFEDLLRIDSFELDNRHPQSAEKTRVTVYMSARSDLDDDFGMAIRLRDQQGLVWSVKLSPILAGIHPTSRWRAGERFRESYDFEIGPGTPPGAYRVELGLYLVSSYRDLIAYTREGEVLGPFVPLGDLVVHPRDRQLPRTAVSPQRPLNARLGRTIDLLGVDASPGSVQAGSMVPFALYYWSRSEIEQHYMIRFQLLNEEGEAVWTEEGEPVCGTYPTPDWRSGELLRGIHEFFVPPHVPAGHYRVVVELTEQGDGRRYTIHRPRWNPWPSRQLVLFDLDVRGREYSQDLPQIATLQQASLGEWGELLGYDLDPEALSPGETLHLTLYWMANRLVTEGYKVFVHIVGQDGHMGTQSDSVPADWSRPTYTWMPGEPITDPHLISLPTDMAPGPYEILIGMYDEETGQRVTLYGKGLDPADHLRLATITVR